MSEAARHPSPYDPAARPQPGPLRDWLAAMKAVTETPAAATPVREAARLAEPEPETRAPETNKSWTPRVVTPAPASAEDADVSDLMAENIMLKAKLKVETDRYDALQGVIARELRSLRAHVEEEMRDLETVRGERDHLVALQAEFEQEIRDLRVRITADAANFSEMRSERDLWAARAEALAQPIFQHRSAV